MRCIIIPIDGDCALGFRCVEFTSCSMADEQFASSICSQLKIELAHRRQEENVTYYRYYMTNKLFPKMIQLPGNEMSGVTMLFTIKLSECEIGLTFRCC